MSKLKVKTEAYPETHIKYTKKTYIIFYDWYAFGDISTTDQNEGNTDQNDYQYHMWN